MIKHIITIFIGIIVGWIIFKKYNIEHHGPNSSKVKNKIHRENGKCYIFEPAVYLCG